MTNYPKQDRLAGLPVVRLGSGETTRFVAEYDPNLALRICEMIADGELLKDICTIDRGMPTKATFYRWMLQYPELTRAYATAREISGFVQEEDTLEMVKDLIKGENLTPSQVRAVDVGLNHLRWTMARRNPRVFGERAMTSMIVPIQINTSLDIGQGKQAHADFAKDQGIYNVSATIPLPEPIPAEEPTGREAMLKETGVLVPRMERGQKRNPKPPIRAERKPRKRGQYGNED